MQLCQASLYQWKTALHGSQYPPCLTQVYKTAPHGDAGFNQEGKARVRGLFLMNLFGAWHLRICNVKIFPTTQNRLRAPQFYDNISEQNICALMVKRLRRRPLTAESRVRFPMGVPKELSLGKSLV